MAQSDQTVQNASFPSVRGDINDNLAALFSQSSGASAPATTVAFQPWVDTSTDPAVWKVRNANNTDWVSVGTISASTFAISGITAIANGGTGETTASAALTALLPSQAGNTGKALVTNGATASWTSITEQCRAWVNFNGTASGTFAGGASTVTRASGSTTATVTTSNSHGLITGNTVYATSGVAVGSYVVTVLTNTTFTITTVATTALNASVILFAVNSIRASYNVSSITDNGVGTYTINFTAALPDANYAIAGFANGISSGITALVSARDTFSPAASSCQIVVTRTDTMTVQDQSHVHVAFFR